MSKITGITQNLRRENHDADSIQGNPGLLIKASIKETSAPSSNTVGIPFEGTCLFSFIIPDTAPNIPQSVPIARHNAKDASDPERSYRDGLYRIACYGMPRTNESSTTLRGSREDTPLPDPLLAKTREEYFTISKLYPVYVGEYIDAGSNTPEGTNLPGSNILPGQPLMLVDNDVQGGVYGSILMKIPLPDGMPRMQFAPSEIRALFTGGEGGVITSGPLDDYVLEQYRLQDPNFWILANVIDSSQPWSALDAAQSVLGASAPFGESEIVPSVSEDSPVPELLPGWNVVQRWAKLKLGSNVTDANDDSVDSSSKGHTYLVHKSETGTVTVVQSSKTRGYRQNVSSWGGTNAGGVDATGYSVGVQSLSLANQEGFDVITGEFKSWASSSNLPCCTFVAAFLREASNPGVVSFETPTES
jgi:hypothetical protein